MRKLPEVREAIDLMSEALGWSTFKWLLDKPRVRATADRANAALDKLEKSIKSQWSDEAKAACKSISANSSSAHHRRETELKPLATGNPQLAQNIAAVLAADNLAEQAREDAEDTFDRAEKHMSLDLAREGCKKAIHSWELREKAIRKAEAVTHPGAAEHPDS